MLLKVDKKNCKIACLPTKHLGVHMNSFKRVRAFQIELEFGSVGFWGEGKTGLPGEKPLGAKERTINKLNPHMASTPGVEPGPHWWERSALTTAPSLAPQMDQGNLLPKWIKTETHIYRFILVRRVKNAPTWKLYLKISQVRCLWHVHRVQLT